MGCAVLLAHLHHQQPLKIHHKTAEEADEVPWEKPHAETSARELEETPRAITFSSAVIAIRLGFPCGCSTSGLPHIMALGPRGPDISSVWQTSLQPMLRTEPRHVSRDKAGSVADGEAVTYPGCHQSTITLRKRNTWTEEPLPGSQTDQGTCILQHHVAAG